MKDHKIISNIISRLTNHMNHNLSMTQNLSMWNVNSRLIDLMTHNLSLTQNGHRKCMKDYGIISKISFEQ